MTSPIIGITSYRQEDDRGLPVLSLGEAYVKAISQAGGLPVLIPLGIHQSEIKDLIPRLDGILLSGGGDVAPALFGAENHPKVISIDPDRDQVETQLIQMGIENGLPFLGICRGIQILNVALGGTLYTHIPDQLDGAVHHPYIPGKPRDYLAHDVRIEPNSFLSAILTQSLVMVNSMHHQGIARLASGLRPAAYAPDHLIEGVELENYRFGLGVQWHPECLTQYESMRALFRSFVEAARK